MTTIYIREATYVDPRAGNDEYYRTFVFGSSWVTQYGRNGTAGTFTKVVNAADEVAANKAAAAKLASKVRKGYEPARAGIVTIAGNLVDVTVLDQLVDDLPPDTADRPRDAQMVAAVLPQVGPTSILGDDSLDDVTAEVVAMLGGMPADAAADEDSSPTLPVRPMLASVQPEVTVRNALRSQHWVSQYKYDGDRVVVEVNAGEIRVLNRQGVEKSRNVSRAHLLPFSSLHSGRWVFDGEVVGRTLVLFDIAAATDGIHTWVGARTGFMDRYNVLSHVAGALGIPGAGDGPAGGPVLLAPVASDNDSKETMLADAADQQREGVILRHRAGLYEQGRRSVQLVKVKFEKDADVVVTALHPTRQSAELSVHQTDGNVIVVGWASTIGRTVAVGDVWVARFLYVTNPNHPRLVQPRLVNRRTDKSPNECHLDQFADAGTNKAV